MMNIDPDDLRRSIADAVQSELRYSRHLPHHLNSRTVAEAVASEVMRRLRDTLPFGEL
jgi:hypothetical protein